MRTFENYNPRAVAVCFLAAAGISMFSMDPIILSLSLAGALAYFFARNGLREAGMHLWTSLLFLATALINPLTYHNGVTVLFVMNNNPITLEALLYGIAAGGMIVSILYWFRSFSQIMTSDKLLYLFGSLSPKISLILSMTLRYIPLFGKQAAQVKKSQTALGLYKEDNIVDRFRGGMRIFSVMVTWALENGIITADSMTARGYGIGRRSHFSIFTFRRDDVLLLIVSVLLSAIALAGISVRTVEYYPAFSATPMNMQAFIGYAAYGILAFLPTIIQIKEAVRWHFLHSKM